MYELERMRRARIFSGFTDEEIETLVALGREKSFHRGDVIFREGALGCYLYLVLDGVVSIHFGDKYIAKCRDWEAFGEMATLHRRPRSATARAVSDTRVLAFGESEIAQLLAGPQAVQFLLNIIEVLGSRLETGNAWIASSLEAQRR